MGTLFDQPAREGFKVNEMQLTEFIQAVKKIAENTDVTFEQAIKCAQTLEMRRRNNLMLVDGDIKDEQLSGFGEILEKIANRFEELISLNTIGE